MNVEEKQRFEKMEQSVQKIEQDISVIKSAIIGNELSGDKGLVGKVEQLEEKVKILTEERIKNTVYIKQLTFVLTTVAVTVIGIIIGAIYK